MSAKVANKQDYLKILAILAMVADHFGLYLAPETFWLRAVGRVSFPIFCFYAGYNFRGCLNFGVLFHGISLYIFTVIFIRHEFICANILISIFLGQIYLFLLQSSCKAPYYYLHYPFLIWSTLFTFNLFEYGSLAILFMVIGFLCKKKVLSSEVSAIQLCCMSSVYAVMSFWHKFTFLDYIITLCVLYMLYISLSSRKHYLSVKYNFITCISRNTLWIYSIHVVIFSIIWRYYINY
ncbi:MAG: hypothetical protein DGJ47_000330 [Rickettsiaceae bacterium]